MEDLYFEEELKTQKKNIVLEDIENLRVHFTMGSQVSRATSEVYQRFDDILYEYYYRKYGEERDILEIINEFKRKITDESLLEMYNNYTFSPEEMDYIKLTKISSTWMGKEDYDIKETYAIADIFLRKIILEEFGENGIKEFLKIMQEEMSATPSFEETIKHYKQLFSNQPYGEGNKEKLEECIEKQAEIYFNDAINCGGYALKVDNCVFPTYQKNFSQSISAILDKFPFVRLLGDKPLQDDEYLVLYRAPQGECNGHHFIRVDSDGIVREKDGIEKPRIFSKWSEGLKDAPEALFAVKKEHKMFDYTSEMLSFNKSLDFEESVSQAIQNRNNSFSYHNHEFLLKKSKEDEVFVTSIDGEIVAQAMFDEDEVIVEINEDKKDYVENFSSGIKPIIQDGKLLNYNQYKGVNREDTEER